MNDLLFRNIAAKYCVLIDGQDIFINSERLLSDLQQAQRKKSVDEE